MPRPDNNHYANTDTTTFCTVYLNIPPCGIRRLREHCGEFTAWAKDAKPLTQYALWSGVLRGRWGTQGEVISVLQRCDVAAHQPLGEAPFLREKCDCGRENEGDTAGLQITARISVGFLNFCSEHAKSKPD